MQQMKYTFQVYSLIHVVWTNTMQRPPLQYATLRLKMNSVIELAAVIALFN